MSGAAWASPRHAGSWRWLAHALCRYCLCCLCGLCLPALPAWATGRVLDIADPAGTPRTAQPLPLAAYLDVLEDPGGQLTLPDLRRPVAAGQALRWQDVPAAEVNFGYSPSAYWLHLRLRNSSDQPQQRWLELGHSGLEQIEFHQVGADGLVRSVSTGSLTPFTTRPYPNRFFVFPVQLAAQAEASVYLRVRSTPVIVPALLWQPEAFHAHERKDYIAQALFFGLAAAMIVYNLLIFIGTRLTVYLWYTAFALCAALALADQNGLAKEFLWPNAPPGWTAISVNIGYSLTLASLLQFMRKMLDTRKVMPGLDRLLLGLALLHALSPLAFVLAFDAVARPATWGYGATALLILLVSLLMVLKRQRPAYFFLPAFLMSLFGTVTQALRALAVLPSNAFTVNGTQFGTAVEMLLLAFALADRFNTLRRQKEQAQAEALSAQAALVQALQTSERSLEARVAQRTAELQSALASADQANRTKSVFLAKVSHELRTPLHAMLGYVDLALRERLPPRASRHINTAQRAGQQLLDQINDLLDFARMERAMLRLRPTDTGLAQWLQQVGDRAQLMGRQRGNRFEMALSPGLPAWVSVDAGRLEQVLMVLLQNAMQYTRDGKVTLRLGLVEGSGPASPASAGDAARAADAPPSRARLRFEVIDTGRGIEPAALAFIFDAFERGESGDNEGLGLGLSIAQQLLGLMGSGIDVVSQPGQGSSFGFTLALPWVGEPAPQRAEPGSRYRGYLGRMRHVLVLVLDDQPNHRRYLELLLGEAGFRVLPAASVPTALDLLQGALPSPDLCIIDQHLEGEASAWDFVLALRSTAPVSAATRGCPVLMLSATAPQRPPGWALQRDIDLHLLKPCRPDSVLQAMGDLLHLVWSSNEGDESTDASTVQHDHAEPAGSRLRLVPTVADSWRALRDAAQSGDLTAVDDWAQGHAALLAQEPLLSSQLQALDFEGIAALAAARLGRSA